MSRYPKGFSRLCSGKLVYLAHGQYRHRHRLGDCRVTWPWACVTQIRAAHSQSHPTGDFVQKQILFTSGSYLRFRLPGCRARLPVWCERGVELAPVVWLALLTMRRWTEAMAMHGALSRRRASISCNGTGSPLPARAGFPKAVLNDSIPFFDLVHMEKAMRGTSGVATLRPKPSTVAARAHWLGRWE